MVNWNGRGLLEACLDALSAQDYGSIETIVVDNGSTDGSEMIAEGRKGVRLLRNSSNLGFAVANNQAIAAAQGEFVALVNYDAILAPAYVSTLVASLRADPLRGSVVGKLIRPAQPGDTRVLDSAGHVMFRNIQGWNRGENEPDRSQYDVAEEVFGVCAAAAVYRREMLNDVAIDGEILDASFFAYLEDVDLDWRARQRGWRSWYEPRAIATHHRSASGARFSIPIQRHIFKNRILMIIKNDAGMSFVWRLPGIAALTAVKLVIGTLHGPAFLGSAWDVLRLTPAAWRKRRLVQSRRTVSTATIEAWFEPYPYWRRVREALRPNPGRVDKQRAGANRPVHGRTRLP